MPWIIFNGGAAFGKFGTEASKGTKVFALAGKIKKGGLVQVPMGMTLKEVLFGIGGGIKNDRQFKAVQMPNSTSFKVMPIGTSTRPPFLILPASANTLVPLEASVPNLPNAAPPLKIIQGTFASVSTLLMSVGFCQKPFAAGNGGFRRGIPLSPSRDAISAVSSPHTNAPAPALM